MILGYPKRTRVTGATRPASEAGATLLPRSEWVWIGSSTGGDRGTAYASSPRFTVVSDWSQAVGFSRS